MLETQSITHNLLVLRKIQFADGRSMSMLFSSLILLGEELNWMCKYIKKKKKKALEK